MDVNLKILAGLLCSLYLSAWASPPPLQLANIYHDGIDLTNYWVSEKYDGVRAFWNGKHLISRQGNRINAPHWFIESLPDEPLDGELWTGRGQFDRVSAIVRRYFPEDADWRTIKYMVFDLPAHKAVFDVRLQHLNLLLKKLDRPFIQPVKQEKLSTQESLELKLESVIANNGEGLMLHLGSSYYQSARSDSLLKLKKYADAEATVVRYFPGKGKYQGMLGSILVETGDGRRFKIGSGFSDEERRNPPPIGSIITYKYFGLTGRGTPRFASFLRIYNRH